MRHRRPQSDQSDLTAERTQLQVWSQETLLPHLPVCLLGGPLFAELLESEHQPQLTCLHLAKTSGSCRRPLQQRSSSSCPPLPICIILLPRAQGIWPTQRNASFLLPRVHLRGWLLPSSSAGRVLPLNRVESVLERLERLEMGDETSRPHPRHVNSWRPPGVFHGGAGHLGMFAAYLNSFRGERTGRKGLVSLREMINYKHRERLEKNHLEVGTSKNHVGLSSWTVCSTFLFVLFLYIYYVIRTGWE